MHQLQFKTILKNTKSGINHILYNIITMKSLLLQVVLSQHAKNETSYSPYET